MNGINTGTVRGKLFKLLIDSVNANIDLLREYGAPIYDESDFDYQLDRIEYDSLADEVKAVFKPKEEKEK